MIEEDSFNNCVFEKSLQIGSNGENVRLNSIQELAEIILDEDDVLLIPSDDEDEPPTVIRGYVQSEVFHDGDIIDFRVEIGEKTYTVQGIYHPLGEITWIGSPQILSEVH